MVAARPADQIKSEFAKWKGTLWLPGFLITVTLAAYITWNFWVVEERAEKLLIEEQDNEGGAHYEISQHNLIFEIGAGSFISLKPRHPLNKETEVKIILDDPDLIDTIGSFKVKADSMRTVFIPVHAKGHAGHCVMSFKSNSEELKNDLFKLRIKIRVVHEILFGWLSVILGWGYFFVWNFSYYPQVYKNLKRRSVVGLSFDYLALNITGHLCYCVFNAAMFYNSEVQREYTARHPKGELPVKSNDFFFSVHAITMNTILIIQCCLYERGDQRVSFSMVMFVAGIWFTMTCGLFSAIMQKISWLQYLYYLSYIKVGTTPIKYTPQVYLNYLNKNTDGWSIYSVFLDFFGGILSLMQMVVDAFNSDDWDGTLGNPGKLGLSFISVAFNIIFMIQHFIIYPNNSRKRRITEESQTDFKERLEYLKSSFGTMKRSASFHNPQVYSV